MSPQTFIPDSESDQERQSSEGYGVRVKALVVANGSLD